MKNEGISHILHSIVLEGREKLTITGVTDVDNFDDKVLLIYTVQGELTVRGRNLQVTAFSTESGDLTALGDIRALIYGDRDKKSKPGFFRKLTR